jgi:acetylornithine deacetylase/succinyl-diaminopimelate desuccinylase-like protein
MADTGDWNKIVAGISDQQVLALEQAAIRIPSTTFEEGKIADLFANYMSDLGLDVEMMEVTHWAKPGQKTRQPIGRLKGTGGGPSLMLNGHMDPGVEMSGWSVDPYGAKFEDGWVWGMGAHDDKGGVVAAICAVEAIVRSGTRLRGDVVVTPVVAHKLGGAGTRALMAKGLRTDLAINMEHSANTIANVCVGIVMVRIKTKSPELFFRYSKEAGAVHEPDRAAGRDHPAHRAEPRSDQAGGWLRFTPHPSCPGSRRTPSTRAQGTLPESYTACPAASARWSSSSTVPGRVETVRDDVQRLLAAIKKDHPAFDAELTIPANGMEDGWFRIRWRPPTIASSALAEVAARHRHAGVVGGWGRLGNVGDGKYPHVPRHPHRAVRRGRHPHLEWPTPDERVPLRDLVKRGHRVRDPPLCA